MEKPKEVTLPSGAILKSLVIPFGDAKDLYKKFLAELKNVQVNKKLELIEVYKNLASSMYSSDAVETALWACISHCTYNDMKITQTTFEPTIAREDYVIVCREVGMAALAPFTKSLYAESKLALAIAENILS